MVQSAAADTVATFSFINCIQVQIRLIDSTCTALNWMLFVCCFMRELNENIGFNYDYYSKIHPVIPDPLLTLATALSSLAVRDYYF